MTSALVLVNLDVLMFLQGGDGARLELAAQIDRTEGLTKREGPAVEQVLLACGEARRAG